MNKDNIIIPGIPLVEEKLDLNDAFNMILQGNEQIFNNSMGVLSMVAQNKEMDRSVIAFLASICHYTIMRAPKMKDEIIKRLLFSRLISAYIAEDKYLCLAQSQRNPDTLEAIRSAINFYKIKMSERFPELVDRVHAVHEKLEKHKYTNDAFRDFDLLLEMIEMEL